MKTMISVDEALKIVMGHVAEGLTESVSLDEALDRVLAEDVTSADAIPPFDNSAMDGYAVRCEDVQGATPDEPVVLRVVDVVAAGQVSSKRLMHGEAIRIMTGAAVPDGTDGVIMVEQTRLQDEKHVEVFAHVDAGQNVRRAGEDIMKGDTVLKKGRRLRPADVGILASVGRPAVSAFRKPRVAVLSTGDELLLPGDPLEPGKIRTSNSHTLVNLIREWGGEPQDIGIARDTPEDTRQKLTRAFESDVVVTSGGVSMGELDHVRDVVAALGVEIKFWKVRQRPGKPLVFGTRGKQLFFGLPGNPVSSMVTCELYVKPALLKTIGVAAVAPVTVRAILNEDVRKKAGLRHFVRGVLSYRDGQFAVSTTGSQSSGVLRSMSVGNCLIDLPEDLEDPKAGLSVEVILPDSGTLF